MQQMGQVIRLQNGKESLAVVQISRPTACGSCGACQVGEESLEVQVSCLNEAGAKVGDWVSLEMGFGNVIKAAFIAYTIPLILLVVGILVGYQFFGLFLDENLRELAAFGFALLLTGIGYLGIRSWDQKQRQNKSYQSVITKIFDPLVCGESTEEESNGL